jgi:long-chain acyl-CoA synthetase
MTVELAPPTEPASLVELFAASLRRHASRPLFATKRGGRWIETTYADFARDVDALRAALSGLGVTAGDRVGIIAGNCVEWAVAAYATYGLGAVFVAMYESQREEEWAFIARDASLTVLFVANREIHAKLERLRPTLPRLRYLVLVSGSDAPYTYASLLRAGAERPVPAVNPRSIDTAALIYTSGTTGEPKGVALTHGNVLANIAALRDALAKAEPHPEEQRTLSFLPWAHAFGHTCELHSCIGVGASMAIAEGTEKIVENLREVRPTVLVAVPRVFLRIYNGATTLVAARSAPVRWLFSRGLAASKKKRRGGRLTAMETLVYAAADAVVFSRVRGRLGGRLKYALSGAAALPTEVAEFIDAVGVSVYEGYGLTETSPIVTANVPGQRKLGSAGRPLRGVRVVIDRSTAGDSPGGEIIVYGPNVMRGYHEREGETRSALTADGGLRTGDLGYLDEDGYLFVTGRIKELYKLANGKYVVPSLLEEQLRISPFVANVMVYGDDRPHNVALIVPEADYLVSWAVRAGFQATSIELLVREPRVRAAIREDIERLTRDVKGYERIQAFALITEDFTEENGLLTPSLKLKRRNVVERWRDEIVRLYEQDGASGGSDVL